MAERTIYIRDNPLRVVVKPHPQTHGTNLLTAETKEEALEHANKLKAAHPEWALVDEAI